MLKKSGSRCVFVDGVDCSSREVEVPARSRLSRSVSKFLRLKGGGEYEV